MSSQPTNMLPKVLALGAGYWAYRTWDNRNDFDMNQARVEESTMYSNDRLHHAQQAFYDGPDTTGMLWLKHEILDPANWHFIKRPMIYVKGLTDSVIENIIPLGLGVCAIGWGVFGADMSQVFWKGSQHAMNVLGYAGKAIGKVSGLLWDGAKAFVKAMPKMPDFGPKETLATAAVAGIGLYYLGLFTKVMTGQVKDDIYTPLNPASLEDAMGPWGSH